jgi:phosphopantothenoylcysteine decarboxylase / phosphopantothenate---cysteine ligase
MEHNESNVLTGRTLMVGVTGGVAAYKTAHLVSRLAQSGAEVTVVMTEAATRFVSPLTFQSLSGSPVYTSQWEAGPTAKPLHIELIEKVDLGLVAPASMDFLARLAVGLADDLLSLTLSAIDRTKTPVVLAPSMNMVMWSQPATQRNIAQLSEDGFEFISPEEGWQACRAVGPGRLADTDAIYETIVSRLR